MKPMTLFLLDPSPDDVGEGLANGRVAAVFTSAEKRQAVRRMFAEKARSDELVDLDPEKLRPFARDPCAAAPDGARAARMLVDATLAFLGVPAVVAVTSDQLFGVVADALRQEARPPRSIRFKGWPEGRKQDLLRLGFSNVAVVRAPDGGHEAGPGGSAAAEARGAEADLPETADPFEGCTFHAWR
jgi:hypothetical protein